MPARNTDHDAVVVALVADGWTITHDPLTLSYGDRDLFVDLAACRKDDPSQTLGVVIAVEIQSFAGNFDIRNLQEAIGQYAMYQRVLKEQDPSRSLYMAIESKIADGIVKEPIGQLVIENCRIATVVYNAQERRILSWNN